ncbi:MAG: Ig-like domain-containing protein, partial [Collimonas sp.]|uniref:Ig-like domain-containing protein n=1 Tax=Collimonas sp. TaxID=1963772 RepID=UPI00326618DE
MAVNTVKLVVVDGNVIKETVDLRSSKKGSPTKVKALKGGKFILAESDTGFAPENVTTHRVGHDLHISLEGTGYDDAELVIEGYYDNDGTLIGLGEDGNYYQYVPTDAESDHFVAALADGATSPQVLGAERLTGLGAFVAGPAFSLLGLGLAALGALGIIGAAVAIGRGDDGSIGGGHDGGQNPGDGHLRPSIGEATDNVGDKTGALHSGDVTDDTAPVFTGTGKPGEQINIIDNGKIIGSTIVGDDGSWTFKPTTPLPDGNHTIIVQPADGGDPSDGFDLIVDTTAPDKVVIDGVDDDFGERMGPVANHGFTDDNTPTLHGHAEAGSTVTIYGNDQMLGTAVADADGNWRFTPTELPDGSYNFTARATDAAGNIGLPSDPYEVIIDTVAPGKPGLGDEGNSNIGDILDDYGPIKGSIDNPGLTDDDTPTLIGKGEPGDTVTIIDNGEVIGTAPVDKDGNWNFTPDPLGDGKHDFTIIVTDPAGNASDESDPWTVVIDTEKPDKPVITSVIDDQGDVTGPINPNGTTDDAQPEIKGTAEADSTVIIKDNGVVIGSTTADKDGNWSFTPTLPLLNGGHELTVEAMDPAGNISDPSDPFNFDLLTGGVPTAPAITGVLDDQGDITGNVAPNGITDDRQPEIHGTAQIGSTVSVYLDGTLLGTAPVNAQGQWSFQVTTDLPDGLHNFTAKATSAAGNVSAETGDYPITVDGTAPGAIVDPTLTDDIGAVTGPINTGDTTDDANPTFTGKGEPGSTVIIKDNGAVIGTAPVDSNGDWTFTPATPLQDGDHSFIAEPVDQAGNHGPETAPIDFTVDTSGVVISITSVVDNFGAVTGPISLNGVTDDTTPTLNGKATKGAIVTVYDTDGHVLGTTTASANTGLWSFTPTSELGEGAHHLTATATTDAAGESAPVAFDLTIDTTAPAAPSITDVHDDVGTIQGTVADNGFTDDTTPTLTGKGEAGSTVSIRDNGNVIGMALVDSNGDWSFTPGTDLNKGSHAFTVVATDPAGNVSAESAPWTVTVDFTAPDQPVIGDILDDFGPVTGSIDNPGLTDDDTPTLVGKGEPGDTVTIIKDGEVIGTAPVDSNGDWTFTPDPLDDGKHDFTIIVTDPAGNASDESDPWTVTIDTEKPDKPVITSVIDDQGDVTGPINPNGVTDDAQPDITGTAEANSIVIIKDNDQIIGSAQVDENGNWSFTPTLPLDIGGHALTVEAMDPAGNISDPSDPFNFDLLTGGVPPAPAITGVLDDQGDITGNVSPNGITDDRQPEIHGTAQSGSIVSVYSDGTLLGTAPVNAQGQWSFQVTTDLPDGLHNFTAKATSGAGNVSPETGDYPITVDGTAPGAIVNPTLTDDIGAVTGPINTGDTTDDANPTFTGKGEPGSTVIIKDNGVEIGTAPVDSNGDWTFTPATPLEEGDHSFTATPVDQAGNHGPETTPIDFTVDTSGVVISITSVVDDFGTVTGPISLNGVTDDTTPTLNGKAT